MGIWEKDDFFFTFLFCKEASIFQENPLSSHAVIVWFPHDLYLSELPSFSLLFNIIQTICSVVDLSFFSSSHWLGCVILKKFLGNAIGKKMGIYLPLDLFPPFNLSLPCKNGFDQT